MWTFGSTSKRLRKLEEENTAFRKALDRLEDLPLKWENTLDMLKKLVGRLNAREKAVERSESDDQPIEQAPPLVSGTGTHTRLQEARARYGLSRRGR
jgi:uncharacterized coiled-coil protein SlyX